MESITVITLQLRKQRSMPWTKLYVTEKHNVDFVLRGLPCALIIRPQYYNDKWLDILMDIEIEEFGERLPRQGKCNKNVQVMRGPDVKQLTVREYIENSGVFPDTTDLFYIVPVFQVPKAWKQNGNVATAGSEMITPAYLIEDCDYRYRDLIPKQGPSMKIPNGEILESCCSACSQVMNRLTNKCTFGTNECLTSLDFPGRTKMMENIRMWNEKHAEMPIAVEGEESDGIQQK